MNSLEIATRLAGSLKGGDLKSLSGGARLDLLDAVNAAIQRMHSVAPPHTKTTKAVVTLGAPETLSLGVTNGSNVVTGATFDNEDLGCTVRIAGDAVDNQVADSDLLLAPFIGTTGTQSATLYHDAVQVATPISEIVSREMKFLGLRGQKIPVSSLPYDPWAEKQVGEPTCWWVEANASFQSYVTPFLIRFDTLPDRLYRLSLDVVIKPTRIGFADLLNPVPLPILDAYVEAYLLPIAKDHLSRSEHWIGKKDAANAAETAISEYATLINQTMGTPSNRVMTPDGF